MRIRYEIQVFILLQMLVLFAKTDSSLPVFASSCTTESVAPRICPQSDNTTQYLQYIKKGGSYILSANDYDPNFFLCEQYNYDCGYVETEATNLQISNGIQLIMSKAAVDSILPANSTLANKIKPYLNLTAAQAKCGMNAFPLILTSAQSTLFFNNFMANFTTQIKTSYSSQRCGTCSIWSNLNINIKTAVLQILKQNTNMQNSKNSSSQFWGYFINNQFTQMSTYLKTQYQIRKQIYLLHGAYLIDSVTSSCNKQQSINFLIDQSGSITQGPFDLALQFLQMYVNATNDDPTLMSFNFYSGSYQSYISYGNDKSAIVSKLQAKKYPGGETNTGMAINATTNIIKLGNFPNGLPKIMVVLTDGASGDSVLQAANNARDNGITIIAVGIGINVNTTQLLQIAQTSSNMILISSYSDLSSLVKYISNYFCKQILTIGINQTISNNMVRVPESPCYFRVIKSPTDYYKLQIDYQSDPFFANQTIFQSQVDPFPNKYTQYKSDHPNRTTITKKVIFIEPSSQIDVLVKKKIYEAANTSQSYVSVGATNMRFNVSLTQCKSPSCQSQRAALAMFSKKSEVNPTVDNYSIYFFILGSLIVLACLSVIGMYFIKKMSGQEETQYSIGSDLNDQIHPQLTEQDLNQNQSNFQQKSTKSKKKIKNDHKSNKSNHSNKKSDKCSESNSDKSQSHSNRKKNSQKSPNKAPKDTVKTVQQNAATSAKRS